MTNKDALELLRIALIKLERWCPVEANITIDTIRDFLLLAEDAKKARGREDDAAISQEKK